MAKRSLITRFIITATSFAGGMALGMLLSPRSGKENRRWIQRQTNDISGWMDHQRKGVIRKSEKQFSEVRKKVHQGIRKNVPDLYDATEEIRLNDSPIIGV